MWMVGRFRFRDFVRDWALTPMLNYYRAVPKSRGTLKKIFRRIDAPVMIVWSEHEPVFNATTLDDLDAWVTNVRIERIERAGHFVLQEARARVNELLLDFVATEAKGKR